MELAGREVHKLLSINLSGFWNEFWDLQKPVAKCPWYFGMHSNTKWTYLCEMVQFQLAIISFQMTNICILKLAIFSTYNIENIWNWSLCSKMQDIFDFQCLLWIVIFQQCLGMSNLFGMSTIKASSWKLYPVLFEVNRSFVIGFKGGEVKILINSVSSNYQSKTEYS